MSKNKKTKPAAQQPMSEEKYIKTKARSLPIVRCAAVFSDHCVDGLAEGELPYKDLNLISLVVVRQQPSGKFVYGVYLVDAYCLGLKNVMVGFNKSKETLDEIFENLVAPGGVVLREVPYNYLHNLVYGAIAYAEDLGFKPHKDFALCQYVLEEDTEDIPLIEFEFGDDEGYPHYLSGPYDNVEKILATLERAVGPDGFYFTHHSDGEMYDDFDDFDEEYDDEDFEDDEFEDEVFDDYEIEDEDVNDPNKQPS